MDAATYEPANISPPQPRREFRGAWVATVGNIDWPSKRDLSVTEQKAELLAILERAAQLKLNAVIFQVRPACDALYASPIEPWSEYLTGAMGKPPQPFYDPLTFAVEEAHKRGLELHAWFNPYRARHPNAKSPVSSNHISKTKPNLVREYGTYLWLDPGEKEVQNYSLSVVMDVVKRYDVDGVHFDDYFYPYAERDREGRVLDFPDDPSWRRSGANNQSSREDWRRENVNGFIHRVYDSVKAAKPWVKFGVSPFGIWRPGNPPQIQGFDAYAELYADSRKWLVNGWLDYLTPQLYWAIEPKPQSFPVLLQWWNEQNPKQRHIWPGINTTKVRSGAGADESSGRNPARTNRARARESWQPDEIIRQIELAARQPISGGHVHWNMNSLMRSAELRSALERGPYAELALVPPCLWLDSKPPPRPRLTVAAAGNSTMKLSWQTGSTEKIRLWVLQFQQHGHWKTLILSGEIRSQILDVAPPDAVSLRGVDRVGNLSATSSLALRK